MKDVSIIVAVDIRGGFGKGGKIPWHFPEDFKHFKDTTMGGICIMGRRTYDDILEMSGRDNKAIQTYGEVQGMGSPAQPPLDINTPILPGRESYVLSRNEGFEPLGAKRGKGLRQVVEELPRDDTREIFVLGGEKLFIEALGWANKIYMTVIKGEYDCDRFFPIQVLSKRYKIDSGKEMDEMYFIEYIRK